MKKFLVLILAIIMVLSVVACSNEAAGEGDEGGAKLPVTKEEGKEKLIEQGSSAKAIDHTGFRIVLTVDDDKIEIGGKDDVFWTGAAQKQEGKTEFDAMEYMFYTEKDGKGYFFMDVEGLGGMWISLGEQSFKQVFFGLAEAMLYTAHDSQQYLKQGADETLSGRSCATYSLSEKIEGKQVSVKFWVDKEYGATLKVQYDDELIDESFKMTVEPTFTNPTLPTGYEAAKSAALPK